MSQVTTDLARIGSNIADLKRAESGIVAGQATTARQKVVTAEEQSKASKVYHDQKALDDAQMAIHQADLKVTAFMLELSRCPDASFIQEPVSGVKTDLTTCMNGTNSSTTFKDVKLESARQQLTE